MVSDNPCFNDHFSDIAPHYTDYRPHYPIALFDWLAGQCPSHQLAWDCATGNGQAARMLVTHFKRIVATDASEKQIELATPHPSIQYAIAPAHHSGLHDQEVDLITVAQALHWFELDAFYAEAMRILKPDGRIAVWCYGTLTVEETQINQLIQHYYHHTVGSYWPAERHHVEQGYRTLYFPFKPIDAPTFLMQAHWTRTELTGYLRSWSATARFIKENNHDPVDKLEKVLYWLWNPPEKKYRITWLLSLRVGYQ